MIDLHCNVVKQCDVWCISYYDDDDDGEVDDDEIRMWLWWL